MTGTERVVLILVALMVTVGAAELVRRELIFFRDVDRWWRIDAAAGATLLAVCAAVGLWASLITNHRPGAGEIALYSGLLLMWVILPDPRER